MAEGINAIGGAQGALTKRSFSTFVSRMVEASFPSSVILPVETANINISSVPNFGNLTASNLQVELSIGTFYQSYLFRIRATTSNSSEATGYANTTDLFRAYVQQYNQTTGIATIYVPSVVFTQTGNTKAVAAWLKFNITLHVFTVE
jgi:hypothetical protein